MDVGDTRSITSVNTTGTLGAVSFSAASQSLTYSANAAAQDALREGQTATDNFTYTMADAAGEVSSATVTVTVTGVNDAPTLSNAIADQTTLEDTALSFQVPANSFADVDVGDTLTYSATLSSGAALPSWLSFNAGTRTFSGTPSYANAGTLSVRVTATDGALLSASDDFNLTVNLYPDLVVTGTAANDSLVGHSGNDLLDGGAGADTMAGARGNDTYVVDNVGDVVTELANEGIDTVQSSVTFSLATLVNVENLTLTGTAAINGTGNTLDNILTGNSANNTLTGDAGSDTLYGGAGTDTLVGGVGNDTYIVDSTTDTITELASEGTDTVLSSVTFTTLAANVENLTLTGTSAINGTGNTLNNVLTGNAAANVLSGGTGTDTMLGGLGDDTYVVDNVGDVVTENAGEGTDLVQSSVTYTLAANVENLTLTGNGRINGTGNTLDNVITGNSANNTLAGGAGNDTLVGLGGADTMIGGTGDDIYDLDSTSDVVTENVSEGSDTIQSSVGWTLAINFENLILTGNAGINGTGNTVANLLVGNSGNNTLNGAAGNDILQGLAGNDILNDSAGNSLFDAGAGTDMMTGNANSEMFIGGLGNDTITTGTGADIIAFNKGAGQDVVNASTGADNVLSIGGGIAYAGLTFAKSGKKLILKTGGTDQITFKDWYSQVGNRSVAKLQVFTEAMPGYNPGGSDTLLDNKVEQFNFTALANAFDAAGQVNGWALTNALLSAHLSGSDTAALGGDLAYQYGKTGSLAGIGLTPAQDVVNAAQFGSSAQTLRTLDDLQQGQIRLS